MRCPFCGYGDDFKVIKEWRFRFYTVRRAECPKCGGIFNHYAGKPPTGKASGFTIRVKTRPRGG